MDQVRPARPAWLAAWMAMMGAGASGAAHAEPIVKLLSFQDNPDPVPSTEDLTYTLAGEHRFRCGHRRGSDRSSSRANDIHQRVRSELHVHRTQRRLQHRRDGRGHRSVRGHRRQCHRAGKYSSQQHGGRERDGRDRQQRDADNVGERGRGFAAHERRIRPTPSRLAGSSLTRSRRRTSARTLRPALNVLDTLPPNVTYVSSSGTGWNCSPSGSTVTCANPGSLANGASSTVSIVARVVSSINGTITNSATLSAATPDGQPSNNTSTASGRRDGGRGPAHHKERFAQRR